jgi:BirA family biotin operon repressor/biotin-[acetyl-CoA-carboxylase] ligase
MSYEGLSPRELAELLRAPSCLSLARVTSVLDIVHELAAERAPAGTVVIADEQVAGRGRHGRVWHSPPRSGIWLGYLLRPAVPQEGGVLAIRVGLTLVEILTDLGVTCFLKWPNDVIVGERKVAGVLCESRWKHDRVRWVAVGVGVNVYNPVPSELADEAVALEDVQAGVTRLAVLERLVPRLHGISDQPQLDARERECFGRHDWLRGRRLGAPVTGVASGIDVDGALLVETSTGTERVVGGGVVAA